MTDNVIYIWEVKPASNRYFPKKKDAIKQVQRYVDANMVRHKIGPNNVILDNTFEVTIPISGITYEVEYCNSIYNTGLIFYRFVRLGKQEEEKEPVTQNFCKCQYCFGSRK